ncbi:hypothetical protein SAMN05444671_0697 [Flavobacterium sp. CF108]|uniref:hypothetical protein n=1 Tax=unclassified Flavobacterium TaxID=196869 RepID=UPI0008AD60CE|nr:MULTISPECIES: hypothetical protein [unclassified Flavobacterium]SEO20431.1 hypothetical protein SAMN04487978_2381 [Flavobacterium sp. fv08]SHG52673.1 hypothetical protein SAMN05444671_0697 [Flavobacterium sp. CF108]
MKKNALAVLISGALLVLVFPYLMTRKFGLIDFSETGNIGDTIGGITSPIVGFVGAILVYYALLEQIKANKIIQDQLNDQKNDDRQKKIVNYLNGKLEVVRADINDFEFIEVGTFTKSEKIYKGGDGLSKFLELYKKEKTENEEELLEDVYHLEKFRLLLEYIDDFVSDVVADKVNADDKKYLLQSLKYHYKSKIKIHLDYYDDYDEKPGILYSISKSIDAKLNL